MSNDNETRARLIAINKGEISMEDYKLLMRDISSLDSVRSTDTVPEKSLTVTLDEHGLNTKLQLVLEPQTSLQGTDVGQGLVAMQDIKAKTCIGVYMGVVSRETHESSSTYTTSLGNGYAVDSSTLPNGVHLVNDNAKGHSNVTASECAVKVVDGGQSMILPACGVFRQGNDQEVPVPFS
ncbi:hypothetical protein J8273_7652 [Carpediemonas membranifera]|uniref:Uncharacterized protein n=1 Tax=Carpediemonas membranifera TaxID=201153 RepID=A0A8J6DXZ9_9EUKA|nr:hypothetical protein J8273_7652 [Carpediemonas membranifera]|eukprot:KAG9391284.1 hypothetical protein J8273_7652 [Carpediemonas membranifera]